MATTALTDAQKHFLDDYDPALRKADLADHLDTLTDDVITLNTTKTSTYAACTAGTPSSETGGPPDYIDVPFQVADENGDAVAVQVNLRVRIFDDAVMETPSTVGNHRLTTDGTTPVIGGDDSIDAVYRSDATGAGNIRVEDVSGASGVSQYLLITDGGNLNYRILGDTATVTFN